MNTFLLRPLFPPCEVVPVTGTDMLAYYAQRAEEYERIYHKPERQADLRRLRELLPSLLADADVLEVACGTGCWTHVVAPQARSILATDANEEVLAIARSKSYPTGCVRFERADAYDLASVAGYYSAGLAAFWWSHIRTEDLPRFLTGLHTRLVPGARVVVLDNRYVEGSSPPICRTDEGGNTYQMRHLDDGSTHEVLKNFPTPEQLPAEVQGVGTEITIEELPYYWCMSYRVR